MKKKGALFMSMLMALLLAFTGCSSSGPEDVVPPVSEAAVQESETTGVTPETIATVDSDEEKILIVRSTGNPFSFTPNYSGDDYGYPVHQNLYNRLCKLDAGKSTPIPDLAESWEYSDDVMTLTFYLKQNAKWHDGEPVTSADVKYTFDTIKANPTYYFSPQMEIVDSIDTPDDYTVVFNFNEPDASFASLLGWYATFVLPQHVYDNGMAWEDNPAGTNPIGSGPFKFENHKDSESITLIKNTEYHDGEPKLDKLIFSIIPDAATAVQALMNGEIDFLDSVPTANAAEVEAISGMNLYFNDWPSPIRIIFNVDTETVGDVNVRKAIGYAINRDEISQKAYFGYNKPEYNLYPSFVSWATNNEDTCPPYDPEEAKRILEEAGYTQDADGYYIKTSLDYFPTLSGGDDTAKLLQSQLRAAGIDLEIISNEYQAWQNKMMSGDFEIELQGGFMGPDPAALKNRLYTGMGSNYGNYSNPEFDELILKGASVRDQAERAVYYKEAQKILSEDLPYMPLTSTSTPGAYWSEFVNMPIEGEGRWGWGEYTWTDIQK